METAVGDSQDYKILAYEEVEEIKREHALLINRIDSTKRKLALETKLRDAAQSLNRLKRPTSRGSQGTRRFPTAADNADLEMHARKCENFATELWTMEKRAQDLNNQLMEHTAGVLQMTHKGIKAKNDHNHQHNGLPLSPESMYRNTDSRSSLPTLDGLDDFDHRSLYRTPDLLDIFGDSKRASAKSLNPQHAAEFVQQAEAIKNTESKLQSLNDRLREMINQANPARPIGAVPTAAAAGHSDLEATLQAHLQYLKEGLEAMDDNQTRAQQSAEKSVYVAEEQLEDCNLKIHGLLSGNGSDSPSSLQPPPNSSGGDLATQLAYLGNAVQVIGRKLENLVTQKSILQTQIKQQRELNSKSDAQKDAQFAEMTKELQETKALMHSHERESRGARDELSLAMERIDAANQELTLREQQRGMDESHALQAEQAARREAEGHFLADLKERQEMIARLEDELNEVKDDAGIAHAEAEGKFQDLQTQLQQQAATYTKAVEAKEKAENETRHAKEELQNVEGEIVRLQTEVTVARAELDGAYGTRAQRAAEVAGNPAVQKELEELNERNEELEEEISHLRAQQDEYEPGMESLQQRINVLEKELTDTIEEYETMTKQSIESEKEREELEGLVDSLRDRNESLEGQLSDEKVKWLGVKSPGASTGEMMPAQTTSTMVLKNEFKKMMRDTRAENMKALRVSLVVFCLSTSIC